MGEIWLPELQPPRDVQDMSFQMGVRVTAISGQPQEISYNKKYCGKQEYIHNMVPGRVEIHTLHIFVGIEEKNLYAALHFASLDCLTTCPRYAVDQSAPRPCRPSPRLTHHHT